jgi:diacylglycerol kinase family enzyme
MDRALVILNPRARRGAGARDYDRVRAEVEAGFRVRDTLLDATGDWLHALDRARREGVERVVAVGGDGTVHAVANAILAEGSGAWTGVTLGAVGIGSSNDFHKPCRTRVRGIPVRIGAPAGRDAGLATWEDVVGVTRSRWFFVSASVGLSARANRRFSRELGVGAWLGARSVDAAIATSAIGTLLCHTNVRARLREDADEPERDVLVSNLGVMLTPYLAGAFRYDTDVQPGQGRFALHLCEGMGRLGLLRAMAKLLIGRFGRTPGTASWSSRTVSLELERDDDLELDGELFRARKVRFEAFPDALAVCS